MPSNAWKAISLQILLISISTRQSIARGVTRNQFQTNKNPVRFRPQVTMTQWNPSTAQSWMNPAANQPWRNPMVPQRNSGPSQSLSTIPSMNRNNQDLRFGSTETTGFAGVGKLRVLSTLFTGLRNTGLEETIAGEIIQRLMKTMLKDIIVPFKSELFQFRNRNGDRN